MRSNVIEEYKNNLSLTEKQRQIIVGLLLGDGHLETQNNGKTYRLKIEHSIEQKEYVNWLYDQLASLVGKQSKERIKNSFDKKITSYGFSTYSIKSLRFYAQQFYQGKTKVMPKIIGKLASPLSLAIWFMDDGSFKSNRHRTYIIHSLGYTRDELETAKEAFMKFGIIIGIHKQYGRWRIYVYSSFAPAFKKLIEPYVISSMRYKLG